MATKKPSAAADQKRIDQLCSGYRGAAAQRLHRAASQGRLAVDDLEKALSMLPAGARKPPPKGKA